ncbi:unnamed protein product [Urochloa decumbens]|uniref:Uncharacterized protein n=1 Tax=Urochloa decumbens TaxID=240449 RepID=A0ABC9C068_9POAL
MAAAAASGIPSPPASLARCCLALAGTAAAAAVIFLWLASMWLAFAATAAAEIGRVACGDGSLVVAAASKVKSTAFVSMVLVTPIATLLFGFRAVNSRNKAERKVPAPETESIAEAIIQAMREMLRNTYILGVVFAIVFMQLTLLVDLVGSRVKESHWGRICSVVRIIGVVGTDAMYCFVIVPTMAQTWWKKQPII